MHCHENHIFFIIGRSVCPPLRCHPANPKPCKFVSDPCNNPCNEACNHGPGGNGLACEQRNNNCRQGNDRCRQQQDQKRQQCNNEAQNARNNADQEYNACEQRRSAAQQECNKGKSTPVQQMCTKLFYEERNSFITLIYFQLSF